MTATTVDRLNGINEGVAVKAPVKAATTANITLSGEQTVDGIALVAGDRVLVKNQTTTTENGIYTVATSAWVRSYDFDGARDIVRGTLVYVISGTVNANKFYQVTTASPVIGSALAFGLSQINSGQYANVLDYGAIGDGASHPLSDYYSTLALAQVDYPAALSLTEEIDGCALQKALDSGAQTVYCPNASGGVYLFNQFITIPYASSGRQGYVGILGDGSTNSVYGTCWRRTISAAGLKFIGGSFTLGQGNKLAKYFCLEKICFDGGWSQYNTSADYPLIDVNAGYELIWSDVLVTNGVGHLILLREAMDSRFENVRVTVGGQHHGYSLSLTTTNASTTATTSSTVGLFAGQKIYGTGLSNVSIASITNSTTIVLSTAANYTGTRTVAFEAKASMHICSNDTGSATSNNLVMNGFRFETGNSCALRIQGNNIIDIWANDFKAEHVYYSMDYLVDIETASVVAFDKAWVYADPSYLKLMNFAVTTAGKTLSSLASASLDSFTPTNMYSVQNGTVTAGSAIVTGLTDTSLLRVGMSVSGTGISTGTSYLGIYIASIDSATQVTLNETSQSGNSGTNSLTFQYLFNSGNFNVRMFFGGMGFIAYDAEDPRNYSFNRVVNYVPATGVVSFDVRHVFGDTSKSITSWVISACHPGLVRFGGSAKQVKGNFSGGFAGAIPVTGTTYLHSLIRLDGVKGADIAFTPNGGSHFNLPLNSFQAQTSTSSVAIGTGAKTFTIATGLPSDMFVADAAVYISQNTVAGSENWMKGTITSYTSGTGALVTNITEVSGSGTIANWKVAFASQPIYLSTNTNADIIVKDYPITYGVPAPSSTPAIEIISDPKLANGSKRVSNIVNITADIYATITPDSSTLYVISDGPGIYLGTTLVTSAVSPSPITNSLGADVALNNTANFFDGPSVAQGSSGTWFVSGTVSVIDTAGTAQFQMKLWDGTTVIASTVTQSTGANLERSVSLSGYLATPAGNLRISVKDVSSTSGKILYNQSGTNKDSTITAYRII